MLIKFEPYTKITFRSHLSYESVESFLNAISLGSPPGVQTRTRLFWANGVLFRQFSMPPSEASAKEIVGGHLILDHIEFTSMPDYENEIGRLSSNPLVSVFVIDVSKHVAFDPLTKWIKDNLF